MTNQADGLSCFDPPYDPRRVANEILREAETRRRGLSNLSLQKVLFFTHAHFMCDTSVPLITEEFEAWQYGPVSRTVYASFRSFDSKIIDKAAQFLDSRTLRYADIPPIENIDVILYIGKLFDFYGSLSAGALVDLSHDPGSPWDRVWQDSATRSNLGMKIPNRLVLEYYRNFPTPTRSQPYGQEAKGTSGYGSLPDCTCPHRTRTN